MHQTQNKCTEENTNAHGFGHPSDVGGAVLPLVGYRNNRARLGRLRARPWHQDEYIATNLGENPTLGLRLRCVKIAGMGATLGGPPIPREAAGLVSVLTSLRLRGLAPNRLRARELQFET